MLLGLPRGVVVHILTDGDCLQSHRHQRVFTRQLQWAAHQCQRSLNGDVDEEAPGGARTSLQALSFHSQAPREDGEEVGEGDGGGAGQVAVEKVEAVTTSTNVSDDYAHRGPRLGPMPLYVYRMCVRRVPRPSGQTPKACTVFPFAPHYALAKSYVQEVVLHAMCVPTIDGFQCPTVQQDAEQNALLKALLFTPFACEDPVSCGSVLNMRSLLSHGARRVPSVSSAPRAAARGGRASQPAETCARYSFQRAWRLRHSELLVLAARADARSEASRKALVLADTVLFAERKEPFSEIQRGEDTVLALRTFCRQRLHRRLGAEPLRLVLAFLDQPCKRHPEQCTLAEFCAYVVRDVIAHIDLAAEARVKKPRKTPGQEDEESDVPSDSGASERAPRPPPELADIGGGTVDDGADDGGDIPLSEISSFPLTDIRKTLALCLQQEDLAALPSKPRKSQSDLDLKAIDDIYAHLLRSDFSLLPSAAVFGTSGFGRVHADMISLQKKTLALAKKVQKTPTGDEDLADDVGDIPTPYGAPEPVEPRVVPLALAAQGPAAVARKLLADATCTEEQVDAVALLAHSLQKRFEARPDKTSVLLPVATAENNHRAVWLGGGGVGKTRTLALVVQPLAETFFGPEGYSATAQSNQAAQNLGPRGRTLHAANGLLMTDSLQTARLRLNAQAQRKMDRLVGSLGVDVIDELGCVPGDLLHADALRKTYGRAGRYALDPTRYMQPRETWGRMPCKILSGDFYQLPPVPASSSLLAPAAGHSYEHQQGRKLLLDMEHVVDFVNMKRFDDPLLREVLYAMRTPGGKKVSEAAWQALAATVIDPTGADVRLGAARGWYECAYEWRIVCYAMHAHARLNAQAARKLLFYVPAVDAPAVRLGRADFDAMRAVPNISTTAKLPGILPVYIGMDVILTESYLPPRLVRGAPAEVVGIELHPQEPPLATRELVASEGCVVLRLMPKCIYVRVRGCTDVFLGAGPARASQPGAGGSPAASAGFSDLRGVLAVQPVSRPWKFKSKASSTPVSVVRTQCPLLPERQCTLHGVQGKTADPGFIAHWKFPRRLPKESVWLAYYVSLSRPRSFSRLLSHGLPDRAIIESGPPTSISEAFAELFQGKVAATKLACARARAEMGWPARAD